MTKCGCPRKNGLHDQCPRKECQGKCACLTLPYPSCCPAAYECRFSYKTMGKRTIPFGPYPYLLFQSPCPRPCKLID